MNAGNKPDRNEATMAVAYANLWDERVGLPALAQRPYPLRL